MGAVARPTGMSRIVTCVLAATTGVLLAGSIAGCARIGPRRAGDPVASPSVTALSNRQAADRDADRILAAFTAPPDAVRVVGRPAGTNALANPANRPAIAALVDKVSWWSLPGTARSVRSAIAERIPSGATLLGTDESGGPYASGEYGVAFAWPVVPGVLDTRYLEASTADVGGRVVLRVDAMVTWLPTRPIGVTIPSGASVLIVTLVPGGVPGRSGTREPYGPVTITDAVRVRRVVDLVNGASMAQVRPYHCPADLGGSLRMELRATATGPALDRVTIMTSGCGGMIVTAADGTTARLMGDAATAARVLTDLALPWPKR